MTQPTESYRVQRTVLRSTAAISGLTGLATLAGWHFHQPWLMAWSPGTAPMQYNTAIGILLCSVGLFLVPTASQRAVISAGGISMLLGLMTLAEHFGVGDLHIDQLLFTSWLVTGTAAPGRMGMNTALCMALTGLALMLIGVPVIRRRHSFVIALAGSGVTILGVIAMIGHFVSIESAYRWGSRTQMAENTTVAFVMIGCGLVTCALFDAGKGRPLQAPYTHGIVGLASVAFTFLLWQALLSEQRTHALRSAESASAQVTLRITDALANLEGALMRLAGRWPPTRRSNTGDWEGDAGVYLTDFPGLQELHWLGESSDTTRAAPRSLRSDGSEKTAVQFGRQRLEAGTRTFLKPEEERRSFLVEAPWRDTEVGPKTLAVVNYQSWLENILDPQVAEGSSIALFVKGIEVFQRGSERDRNARKSEAPATLYISGEQWDLRVWPGPEALASAKSSLINAILIAGLVMSLLLALTAHLILIARKRADVIEEAQKHLEDEVVERRLAEASLLEARSTADIANRAKSDFLANMSHEIRTPMNAILGMADLLWESELSGEQREYVGAFRRAGTNLLALINDILDIARIESGKFELHPIDFNLDDVVATVEMLRGRAEAKGLSLALHISPDVPRALNGDSDRLRQVLINLLGNAIKFTSAGEVGLEVDLAAFPGWRTYPVRFRISDTGPGIPVKKLALIFDSFTQADTSIAHQHGGTGLGLTISRNLVELMGGRLEVSSEEGKGSVFAFVINFERARNPIPKPANPATLPARPDNRVRGSLPKTGKGRILLAEDSPDNQLLIRAYLKQTAYQLEIAEDGQMAFDKFTTGAFDLILMDVQMPVMDGYAATRKIREWEKQSNARRVPILALTAYAMADESRRSREAGCDAHLTKPIPMATLLKALEEHLKAHETIRVRAPEGIDELIPGYLRNRRADLGSLRAALEKNDYGAIQVVGHQMKGTGTSYGFAAISDIGRSLELAAKQEMSDVVGKQILALADYLNRVEIVRVADEISVIT